MLIRTILMNKFNISISSCVMVSIFNDPHGHWLRYTVYLLLPNRKNIFSVCLPLSITLPPSLSVYLCLSQGVLIETSCLQNINISNSTFKNKRLINIKLQFIEYWRKNNFSSNLASPFGTTNN